MLGFILPVPNKIKIIFVYLQQETDKLSEPKSDFKQDKWEPLKKEQNGKNDPFLASLLRYLDFY